MAILETGRDAVRRHERAHIWYRYVDDGDAQARLWHEEVSWVGKIAYIVLVVVLPVAAYILRVWLESHTAHN